MKRTQILAIAAVVIVAAVLGGIYRFYVQEKLQKFAADEAYLAGLQEKYTEMNTTFSSTEPEIVIDAYLNKVNPWVDALERRTDFYTLGGIRDIEPIPEGQDSRWYYINEAPRLIKEVSDAYAKQNVPVYTDLWFQSPQLEQLKGVTVKNEDVTKWLENIKMGGAVVQQLLAANALRIDKVVLWPKRPKPLLNLYTVGVSMYIRMEDLAKFLNSTLSDRNQCYFINAIRIKNRVLTYDNPALEVQMIYTMSEMRPAAETMPVFTAAAEAAATTGAGAAAGAKPNLSAARGGRSNSTVATAPKKKGDLLDRIVDLFPF